MMRVAFVNGSHNQMCFDIVRWGRLPIDSIQHHRGLVAGIRRHLQAYVRVEKKQGKLVISYRYRHESVSLGLTLTLF